MPPQVPGYNPYSFPDEYSAPIKQSSRLKAALVVVGILGLVAICVIVLVMSSRSGGNDDNSGSNDQNQNQSATIDDSSKDVIDRSDGTLKLSSKITLNTALKAQTVKGNEKQQLNLSSGFSFMVNQTQDYVSPGGTSKPADGKKFIVVTVVVGNRLNTGNLSVSYLDFRLRDDNNSLIAGSAITNEILNNTLASPTEIKPGEQITGQVVFEVDATDASWVFKHSETYQKTTDNTTFNVEGEIVVKLSTASTKEGFGDTTTTTTDQPTTGDTTTGN